MLRYKLKKKKRYHDFKKKDNGTQKKKKKKEATSLTDYSVKWKKNTALILRDQMLTGIDQRRFFDY